MKIKKITAVLLPFALLALGCGKSKTADTTPGCVMGNYGILTVNFASADIRHSVSVRFDGVHSQDKALPLGAKSDTLHIKPGNFPIRMQNLDNDNKVGTYRTIFTTIRTCKDTTLSVSF
ncbi:hypothetical protein SAMN05216464_103220 [Mucilaginibacter pineti]|uniref:Lipoprotein n=1 Tax=Mucilaginibacter pineti TaxID=1391627 RepID=A0A1G6Z6Z1_9SPHI|nr:hypothetical protein [Mucilaginibacter pineti]SDD97737.1 hypothetical protein SAMN05216464_103220 [Mucilaginibacter pineti]